MRPTLCPEPLLKPGEVAALFGVDSKTVTRWAKAGRLRAVRTLGGHRRYRESEVRMLLGQPAGPADAALADVRAILGEAP